MKENKTRWDVYFVLLVYPHMNPKDYARLVVEHLEWCNKHGIYQPLHACYKTEMTEQDVRDFVKSIEERLKIAQKKENS